MIHHCTAERAAPCVATEATPGKLHTHAPSPERVISGSWLEPQGHRIAAAISASQATQRTEARYAPTPPKAGPLHQESGGLTTKPSSILRIADSCERVDRKDSNSAARSQRDVSPAALMRVGDQMLPSASGRGAKASDEQRPAGAPSSSVRRTDGVAPTGDAVARTAAYPVVGAINLDAHYACGKAAGLSIRAHAMPAGEAGDRVVRIDGASLNRRRPA